MAECACSNGGVGWDPAVLPTHREGCYHGESLTLAFEEVQRSSRLYQLQYGQQHRKGEQGVWYWREANVSGVQGPDRSGRVLGGFRPGRTTEIENHLPLRPGRLAFDYIPDPAQIGDVESMRLSYSHGPEAFFPVAVKADRGVREGMTRSALAGLECLDPGFHQYPNNLRDTGVQFCPDLVEARHG